MSLKQCKHCGGNVASTARACPHCGAPRRQLLGNIGRIIIAGVLCLILYGCMDAFDQASRLTN